MRFGNVVIAYFVIGVLFWGAGLVGWGSVGIADVFIDDPQSEELNEDTAEGLESARGPIENALSTVGGGALLAVWEFLAGLVGAMFWPINVLYSVGAPVELVVLLGGTPTAAFYVGVILLIRGS